MFLCGFAVLLAAVAVQASPAVRLPRSEGKYASPVIPPGIPAWESDFDNLVLWDLLVELANQLAPPNYGFTDRDQAMEWIVLKSMADKKASEKRPH